MRALVFLLLLLAVWVTTAFPGLFGAASALWVVAAFAIGYVLGSLT